MSPSLTRDSTAYRGVRGQPPSPVGPKPARSDQPLEETRTGDPEPRTRVPTKRDHWPEQSVTATSAHCATTTRTYPLLTPATAGPRPCKPPALTPSTLQSLLPREESRRARLARPRDLPPLRPNVLEPKSRDIQTRPWEVTNTASRYPHDPSTRRISVAVTIEPRSTAPAIRCRHRTPATGSEDPTAATCVPTGSADHGKAPHHRATHAVSTFAPRPKP